MLNRKGWWLGGVDDSAVVLMMTVGGGVSEDEGKETACDCAPTSEVYLRVYYLLESNPDRETMTIREFRSSVLSSDMMIIFGGWSEVWSLEMEYEMFSLIQSKEV